MSAFTHSVLTDVGWDQLASTLAGKNLIFLRMEAGDGTVTGDAEMQTMTALKNKIMDIPITSYSDDGKGQITLIGTLTSKAVDTAFYFRELGVIATLGGSLAAIRAAVERPDVLAAPVGEQLYCVANSYDSADYIPDKNNAAVVVQNIEIVVKIDRSTSYEVIIAAGADVTAQNIGPTTVGAGYFRDKIGSILNFKRLISTSSVRVSETEDTVSADVIFPQGIPTGCMMDYPDMVPPSGWLNCDGSAKARATYPNLFSLLGTKFGAGDGFSTFNLPDFRGKVSVGAGSGPGLTNRLIGDSGGIESVTLTLAQMPLHGHSATASAHNHVAWQDVHNHYVRDPGHAHSVYDGTHAHGIGDPGHAHSIADPQHSHMFVYANTDYANGPGVSNDGQDPYPWYNNVWGWVNAHTTDIGIYGAGTGIWTGAAYSNTSIYAAGTGIWLDNAQPAVYTANAQSSVTLTNSGGNQPHTNMPPFLVINKIIKI